MKLHIPLLAAALLSPLSAVGEPAQKMEDVVVTATRTEVPLAEVSSSVTVIGADEIRRRQAATVAELLRTVPGVDIVRTGGAGGQVSIFTRGTESNHTLVLIDSVEVTDPGNFNNQIDLSGLLAEDIERIEVVRGPQSTLYGSDAIGGVVHIITRRGDARRGGSAEVEGGKFSTLNARGNWHGGTETLRFGGGVALQDTDSIPAFAGGGEEDTYKNTTLSAYLSVHPGEPGSIDLTLRYVDSKTEIDDFDSVTFSFADDDDSRLKGEQLFARLQFGYNMYDGLLKQRVGVGYTDIDRNARNGASPANTFPSNTDFTGRKLKADWLQEFTLSPAQLLTLGLETEEEKADTFDRVFGTPIVDDESARTNSFFLQDQYRLGREFVLTAGVRRDDHEDFGAEWTWRVTPAWRFAQTGTRLKGSYGTGFKAPSLSELFDPFFGNPALEPETSKGWDAGIEQSFLDEKLRLELVHFDNRIDDLIGFDPVTFQAINTDKADIDGWELGVVMLPRDSVSVKLGYTKQDARDGITDAKLLRRPDDKADLRIDWTLPNRATLHGGVRHVGKRDDFIGFAVGKLDSYTVGDIAVSWPVWKGVTLLGRVENVFDEDYEEVAAFGTPGRAWYAGLRYAP